MQPLSSTLEITAKKPGSQLAQVLSTLLHFKISFSSHQAILCFISLILRTKEKIGPQIHPLEFFPGGWQKIVTQKRELSPDVIELGAQEPQKPQGITGIEGAWPTIQCHTPGGAPVGAAAQPCSHQVVPAGAVEG